MGRLQYGAKLELYRIRKTGGSDIRFVYRGRNESSGLTNVAVDSRAKVIFWADEIGEGEKGLWRANLDGSSRTLLFKSPDGCGCAAMALVWQYVTDRNCQ